MLLLLACGAGLAPVVGLPPAPPVAIADALEAGSCNVCHQIPEQAAASRLDSCQDCHAWIQSVAADPAKREVAFQTFELWERYETTVHSYEQVPSLAAAMARLQPQWIAGYLNDPYDLRPHLDETMPRMDLSEGEREAIALWFASASVSAAPSPAPDPSNLVAGEAMLTQRACTACHSFGAVYTGGVPMAPDLAHTRYRMDPDLAVQWIVDPKSVSDHATMLAMGVTRAEAVVLRDYIYLADPEWVPAAPRPGLPAATTEPVSWQQVNDRVFGRICAHCHMEPSWNEGRTGPGNTGGFGWDATGIELQTCAGVASLAQAIPGTLERRALVLHRDQVQPGEQPASLTRPERPGMPMGLPAIPDADIALVLGWIEQGALCPDPTEQESGG